MDLQTESKPQLSALAEAVEPGRVDSSPVTRPPQDEHRPYFEIINLEIPAIIAELPRNLRVLDVGCGSGMHGAELRRRYGHRVTGVDLSPSAIGTARTRLEAAYIADITRPADYPFDTRDGFDLIVFSDILEHVNDPDAVLSAHLKLLKPGGRVLVSLPNVAIWNVRLELLFGRFEYQDTGTLDRTHVRFFNGKNFRRLLHSAGLREEKSRITPGVLRPLVPLIKLIYASRPSKPSASSNSATLMDSAPYRLYCRVFYPIERLLCSLWPGLLAFQFVALCKPDP